MFERNQQNSKLYKATELVGILNITPDSFSDGGKFTLLASAILHAEKLIKDGAAVIDIGAESTRPGAIPLSADEEWERLAPILPELIDLCHQSNVLVSVDTRHPETAKMAITLGADWINDVSGFTNNAMVDVVKNSDVPLVFMHNLGVPAAKDVVIPADIDVVNHIVSWARERIDILKNQGIAENRLIFDPGIGFGKTTEQSWDIINRIDEFKALGVQILVGHSRKSFLGQGSVLEKDAATVAISEKLAGRGVNYLRVHDVAGNANGLYKAHRPQAAA